MDGTDPEKISPQGQDSTPVAPPPPPIHDDDSEDGDFATPKRDRTGNDDEPL